MRKTPLLHSLVCSRGVFNHPNGYSEKGLMVSVTGL